MFSIRGRFDGKVIVPDEPLDLPPDQALLVHLEPVPAAAPNAAPRESFFEWAAKNTIDDPSLPADSFRNQVYRKGSRPVE